MSICGGLCSVIDAIVEIPLRTCEYAVQKILSPGPLVLLVTQITHRVDKFVYVRFLGEGIGIFGRVAYEVVELSKSAV
jgi:hypothetical protein